MCDMICQDNSELFAIMEKTRLYVVRGLEAEVCTDVQILINNK